MEPLLTELERLFSALSDRTRLSITLLLLEKGELTVDEISKDLKKSQSLISHHLSCLRNCGIVKVRKDGKYSLYSIASDNVAELIKVAMRIIKDYSESILGCEVLNEEKHVVKS
ncbi:MULTISPECIES: ArsR/SmtB family transcription factor [Sulfolobaceae]|uniref:Mercury resistance operon repressor MerR n=2 Tax=Sulfurisphaera tokodaii TaxID=111955 RepID=F9VNU6_SULTO|nr:MULTISPECIES: metalloregulator ArsR/SmtB family transcription factor [Sulfolobaceae]QIW23847.1 ArsR family transcriptional regulator [Sulfolobus sp. S-194]BAK54454.1 mercury resistance operon repressor MerR [Sulfurisphaera tokodaii str. 7]HII75414.1 winged helix-turn-helix transcriptional regulator [Sulfurisphaera tokodaii]